MVGFVVGSSLNVNINLPALSVPVNFAWIKSSIVCLSTTAEETGQSVEQVEEDVNESMENPATTDDGQDQTIEEPLPTNMSGVFLEKEYEIYK